MKSVQRNMDVNGKTRSGSIEGFANAKAKGNLEEAEGIIKGASTKAGEAVIQGNKIPTAKSPKR